MNLKQDNGPKIIDTWYDNGSKPGIEGVDFGCWGEPTDCYEPLELHPNPPVLAFAFSAIATGDDSIISSTFSVNQTELEAYLREADVDAVINGAATATARTGRKTRYMVIVTIGGVPTVVSTYPFRK